tara:strand:- start:458 stop:802 length:345 start_codon:yes stop_codon:yes gene_type:complete
MDHKTKQLLGIVFNTGKLIYISKTGKEYYPAPIELQIDINNNRNEILEAFLSDGNIGVTEMRDMSMFIDMKLMITDDDYLLIRITEEDEESMYFMINPFDTIEKFNYELIVETI